MSKYKLYYFNVKGRAEAVRWIFKYIGQDFEDKRIAGEEWMALKPETPFGQMPMLVESNGFKLAQSITIERYLATKFGIRGKNDQEGAIADMIVDTIMDMAAVLPWREQDKEKQAQLRDEAFKAQVPPFLEKFEKRICQTPGVYFLESGLTYADIHFAAILNFFLDFKTDLLDPNPNLNKLYDTIIGHERIKKWLEERPKTAL